MQYVPVRRQGNITEQPAGRERDRNSAGTAAALHEAVVSPAKKGTRPSPSPVVADSRQRGHGPRWEWRTFPVVAAFVFGALVASFLDQPNTDFAVGVRILLLVAAAGCMAHMFVGYVIIPRRMAARGVTPRVDEEPYEDSAQYADELVFEDEP